MAEPMAFDRFQQFADTIDTAQGAESVEQLLDRFRTHFGLANAVYLGLNIPRDRKVGLYVATTYSEEWKVHYLSKRYDRIDPVVQSGLRRITPLDWAELDRSEPKVRQFFGEAQEFGVGKHGLSFPIRGLNGEMSLFSVNGDCSQAEWDSLKKRHARDFQSLAFHLHTIVLKSLGVSPEARPNLTPREIDCLGWAAAGKTEWATAEILGLSVKTVRFHIENAKVKLCCVTKTQAVAKCVRLAMI